MLFLKKIKLGNSFVEKISNSLKNVNKNNFRREEQETIANRLYNQYK